jgi:hypothetical protein
LNSEKRAIWNPAVTVFRDARTCLQPRLAGGDWR